MRYAKIVRGSFKERPNRFVAVVEVNGELQKVHVKNTGRCRELLVPGAQVLLEDFDGRMGARKMRYSLVGVIKETDEGPLMINMDSQAPNQVVREALESGLLQLPGFGRAVSVRWEYRYGDSRIDFYMENEEGRCGLMEVKGVTLEHAGVARFPDAPTERGIKHIRELETAQAEGYYTAILFVIQMKGIREFRPNDDTHRAFGDALREAAAKGVNVLAYDCIAGEDELVLDREVSVELD
ncbi:MAG: DNA/RNA nuclease SfsA [Firmicutes bacterium]|nr:DNA/RNA nuclease SfsA [Bacillota bacterium]